MSEMSDRLRLPWLVPGQAQKEMTHNEALALLDIAVQPVVEAVGVVSPPAAPVAGQCWITAPSPVGDWAGHPNALAGWTDGGWRFIPPVNGMSAWSVADAMPARWTGAAWVIGEMRANRIVIGGVQVVGPRAAAVAAPSGGTVIDGPARSAISGILAVLSAHGLTA